MESTRAQSGGGKVEARAIKHAQELLQSHDGRSCDFVVWNLQTEIGMDLWWRGQVLLRSPASATTGRFPCLAQDTSRRYWWPMLLQMNCRVTCLDQRQEWLDKMIDHPRLTKVCPRAPGGLGR